MIRGISYALIAIAVLVTGYIGWNRLNYWERSVRIFSANNSEISFEGRTGRGRGERRISDRNVPDSLRRQFTQSGGNRAGRFPDEGGFRNSAGRGRGDIPGGKRIRLTNVMWFLAVFAAFTAVIIYLDKAFCLIRKSKKVNKQ